MKEQFKKWMREKEKKKPTTVDAYANSIDKIIEHYYEKTGKHVNIYNEMNLQLISNISNDYGLDGRFRDFGNYGNGTVRNAIATYLRFLKDFLNREELEDVSQEHFSEDKTDKNMIDDDMVSSNYNFTYERDLKKSLILQFERLFPGYKIFGDNQEGIEYNIYGKRVDLLLINKEDNSLLAIEIKAGKADFRVFGQISMYLGLLSKKFSGREIKGMIIAGEIDETLVNACIITDKIELKTYKLELSLQDFYNQI